MEAAPINSSFYLTIYTYILGRVGISKYMEYQDVIGVAKDVISRQKIHSSDIENIQNKSEITGLGKRFVSLQRGYKGQYSGIPQVKSHEEIIAIISLNNCRILRSNGKVWDQVSAHDSVWFVTDREWELFSNEVLLRHNGHSGQMMRQRHGRRLIYRHPSALTLPKLQEFVDFFFCFYQNPNSLDRFSPQVIQTRPSEQAHLKNPILHIPPQHSKSEPPKQQPLQRSQSQPAKRPIQLNLRPTKVVSTLPTQQTQKPTEHSPLQGKTLFTSAQKHLNVQKSLSSNDTVTKDSSLKDDQQIPIEVEAVSPPIWSNIVHSDILLNEREEGIYSPEVQTVMGQMSALSSPSDNISERGDEIVASEALPPTKSPPELALNTYHDNIEDMSSNSTENECQDIDNNSPVSQRNSPSRSQHLDLQDCSGMETNQSNQKIATNLVSSVNDFTFMSENVSFFSCTSDLFESEELDHIVPPPAQNNEVENMNSSNNEHKEVIDGDVENFTQTTMRDISKSSIELKHSIESVAKHSINGLNDSIYGAEVNDISLYMPTSPPHADLRTASQNDSTSNTKKGIGERSFEESSFNNDDGQDRNSNTSTLTTTNSSNHSCLTTPVKHTSMTKSEASIEIANASPQGDFYDQFVADFQTMNKSNSNSNRSTPARVKKQPPHLFGQDNITAKYRLQAAELEEVTRARAALEVRLEETKNMLQIFANENKSVMNNVEKVPLESAAGQVNKDVSSNLVAAKLDTQSQPPFEIRNIEGKDVDVASKPETSELILSNNSSPVIADSKHLEITNTTAAETGSRPNPTVLGERIKLKKLLRKSRNNVKKKKSLKGSKLHDEMPVVVESDGESPDENPPIAVQEQVAGDAVENLSTYVSSKDVHINALRSRLRKSVSPEPSLKVSNESSSATKLLGCSSKFFPEDTDPSDILDIENKDLVQSTPNCNEFPAPIQLNLEVNHSEVVVPSDFSAVNSSSSIPKNVKNHPVNNNLSPQNSKLISKLFIATSSTEMVTAQDVEIPPSSSASKFDSTNKSNSHIATKRAVAPPVVQLVLPDFDDDEDEVDGSLLSNGHSFNEPLNKKCDIENLKPSVAENDSSSHQPQKQLYKSSSTQLNQSFESNGRSRSGSNASSKFRTQTQHHQVPSDVSFQYLSQLRYVLEEIDDVISSTPPIRKNSFILNENLPVELDAVASAAAAAAAVVAGTSNRLHVGGTFVRKRANGESLRRKEDKIRRKPSDLESSMYTDEEASFPSINSRDKIVQIRKRLSYKGGQPNISGGRRDDSSTPSLQDFSEGKQDATRNAHSQQSNSAALPNGISGAAVDYNSDAVSVSSQITMESANSPSPTRGEALIPTVNSNSHLPIYSYIEQDFEYFYRAQQQYKLRYLNDPYLSDGIESQHQSMPPSRSLSDRTRSSSKSNMNENNNHPLHHQNTISKDHPFPLNSRSLSYSNSFDAEVQNGQAINVPPDLSHKANDRKSLRDQVDINNSGSPGDESKSSSALPYTAEVPTALDAHLKVIYKYYIPFLLTTKQGSNQSATSSWESVLWVVFQLYGIMDGVIVKHIKTSQISRALKDASICTINSSQIDLMLVKVYSKLTANKNNLNSPMNSANSAMNTTTATARKATLNMQLALSKSLGQASTHIVNPAGQSLSISTFDAFTEVMLKVAEYIISNNAKTAKKLTKETTIEMQVVLMEIKLKELIVSKCIETCQVHLVESKVSISGVLLKTVYDKFTATPNIVKDSSSEQRKQFSQQLQSKTLLLTYSSSDFEMVRAVWERNMEQTRQIFTCYAMTSSHLSHVNGTNLLTFEECKEMVSDFHIVPQLLDGQCFARIFRTCKLFEWRLADIHKNDFTMNSKTNQSLLQEDYFDFKSSIGNFSLTFHGFVECLTRVACNNNKLGPSPSQSVENLLHLMDISGGKAKLGSKFSRKSTSIKSFSYSGK